MTTNYNYANMSLEEILAIENEEENEQYDLMDREQDEIVDHDKWNSCCGGRTTYGKNYEEY
jgi:hypothetical protein